MRKTLFSRCNRLYWHGLFCFILLILEGCSSYQSSQPSYPASNLAALKPYYAAVQNGHIEYYRFGQGSPIVLVPGYATDVSSWNKEFLAALATQHQVIVFNNRNVGGSLIHSRHYESKSLASDTFQLIQNLKLKKPAILGISMGGMIAEQLAIDHPAQLGQLVLINTVIAGGAAVHPDPAVEQELMNMPHTKLGRYATAVKLFFPDNWKARMAVSLAVERFQPAHYQEKNLAAIMPLQKHLVNLWVHDNAAARKLAKLPLPVLVLNGEADIVIPPVNSDILAKTLPNARLIRWKEGGHAMIYQYPREMARAVNQFIQETK